MSPPSRALVVVRGALPGRTARIPAESAAGVRDDGAAPTEHRSGRLSWLVPGLGGVRAQEPRDSVVPGAKVVVMHTTFLPLSRSTDTCATGRHGAGIFLMPADLIGRARKPVCSGAAARWAAP